MSDRNDLSPTVEELEDGSTKITTADGRVTVIDQAGNATTNLPKIGMVGFENIFDIKNYSLTRDGNTTTHLAEFHDGGHVKIAVTDEGKLTEFSGTNFGQTITLDGDITIRSSSAAKRQ